MTNSFDNMLNEVKYFESQRNGDFYNDYSLENLLKEFLSKYAPSCGINYSSYSNEYQIYEMNYDCLDYTKYHDSNLKELLIWFLKDNYRSKI